MKNTSLRLYIKSVVNISFTKNLLKRENLNKAFKYVAETEKFVNRKRLNVFFFLKSQKFNNKLKFFSAKEDDKIKDKLWQSYKIFRNRFILLKFTKFLKLSFLPFVLYACLNQNMWQKYLESCCLRLE